MMMLGNLTLAIISEYKTGKFTLICFLVHSTLLTYIIKAVHCAPCVKSKSIYRPANSELYRMHITDYVILQITEYFRLS